MALAVPAGLGPKIYGGLYAGAYLQGFEIIRYMRDPNTLNSSAISRSSTQGKIATDLKF
jgi:hypothetical protein